MARNTFGGGAADFVAVTDHTGALRPTAATLTCWSAQTGGTQYSDLLVGGSPASSVPVNADGQVPTFQGPDRVETLWASAGGTRVRLISDAVTRKVALSDLTSWPIFAYGNSYAILIAGWFTLGRHYLQLAASRLGGGAVTSYAVGGRRILDVCATLIAGSDFPGMSGADPTGLWPGTSSRAGLCVLDSIINDNAHYANMTAPVPAAITTANTRYLTGVENMYRTALALMSTETRIEQTAATFTGTWGSTALVGPSSGGSVAYATAVGAACQFSVTPPQTGPLVGKVYFLSYTLDPSVGTICPTVNVSIDGGANVPVTVTAWEQYTGTVGTAVYQAPLVIAATLPVDGNAHTVKFTHAGAAGNFFYADGLLVPSTSPNPIMVMGGEHSPEVGVFNAAQIAAYRFNMPLVIDRVKTAVAAFGNAIYVPSTMTASGLYSVDKLHENDRGMEQRAGDLVAAAQPLVPRLNSRALALRSDASFGII